jgi:8-oxo-dGTP pyrophosphatase MutT (NUDIX family)
LQFDPETARLVEQGSSLPHLAASLLSVQGFKKAFKRSAAWVPDSADDSVPASRLASLTEARPASVLIPVVQRDGELRVVLTLRTAHLQDHAGQISFPGGRQEVHDTSPEQTALREAWEEIGLASHQAEVLGLLPEYLTASGYRVTPVVALIQAEVGWKPDPNEVAEILETPLSFLMNPAHHEKRQAFWSETRQGQLIEQVRHFYAMPWQNEGKRYFIWGATAAMLRNLYLFLRVQA